MKNKRKIRKTIPVFNIVIISIIVLLVAGLFLLEKYKLSGYVYEGEYLYSKDERYMIIDVEYNQRNDELLIDIADIYRAEIIGDEYCMDVINTEEDLVLSMSDMDAALYDIDDFTKHENIGYFDLFDEYVQFDKRGLTLTVKSKPIASYIDESGYYFYKNGWLNYINAEIAQVVFIAGILVSAVICTVINCKKRKRFETQVTEENYDKFTVSEVIYLHDSFKGMEEYFENNVLDSVVELDEKYCKILEKEINNPKYKVSMVKESYLKKSSNNNTKQIEILDENGNLTEYVVSHRKEQYILKHRVENMTLAIYKLKRIVSLVIILGLVGLTFSGCRQSVKYEYKVMGRIADIKCEGDVIRLNMAIPTIYSYEEGDTKTIEYVFDKDEYFTYGESYMDIYYEEATYGYVEYKLSKELKNKIDIDTILNETSDYIYELHIVNGEVQDWVKTDYYCLSHDNVPLGMYGELYCGLFFYVDRLYESYAEYEESINMARWYFSGETLVFNKVEDDIKTSIEIENIEKLRMYRIDNPTGSEEIYWIDTPQEDLLIKIKQGKYEVFSYPGGVFLDEEGRMGYYNSDVTESAYKVTDLGYEVIEQTINVINKGGK